MSPATWCTSCPPNSPFGCELINGSIQSSFMVVSSAFIIWIGDALYPSHNLTIDLYFRSDCVLRAIQKTEQFRTHSAFFKPYTRGQGSADVLNTRKPQSASVGGTAWEFTSKSDSRALIFSCLAFFIWCNILQVHCIIKDYQRRMWLKKDHVSVEKNVSWMCCHDPIGWYTRDSKH